MALEIPQIKNIQEFLFPFVGNVTIIEEVYKPLIGPGENYGSLLLSVELLVEKYDKTKENLNIIAKLCPPNEWLKRMFASSITFKQEINFYMKIVPTLINFQKEYNVEEDKLLNIFPKCLNARINLNPRSNVVDDDACILLENLRIQGYKSINRMISFNLQEAEIVLRDLARFHAVPLAYKIKNPNNFKQQILPLLNRVLIGAEMFETVEDKFVSRILRHLNLSETEVDRFVKGMYKGFEFQNDFPTGNEKYATIVHCDFWLNNTMVRFLDDKPVHNKMLDFQVVTYGAPATDVVFFLYTSIKLDILDQYYDYLLQFYYKEFIDCLKSLNCNVSDYSYDSFEKEINHYGPLEASHIFIMFKAIFSDSKSTKNIDNFNIDDMFNDEGITDIYKLRLQHTVKKFLDKNWL